MQSASFFSIRQTSLSLRAVAALSLILACSLLTAKSAMAVPASTGDKVTFPLGNKGSGLRVKGLRLKAVKPAGLSGSRLTLPVTDIVSPTPTSSQLILRGGVQFTSGRRKVKVEGFLLSAKNGRVSVTAKVGGSRLEVFSGATDASTTLTFSPPAIKFSSTKFALTRKAAAKLKKSLGNSRVKPRVLGRSSGAATAFIAPVVPTPDNPSNKTLPEAPPPITRPGTAVDITSANIRWWVRDSWVTYLSEGSLEPQLVAPATAYAPQPENTHACPDAPDPAKPQNPHLFSFDLPFTSGWYDATSSTAAIYTAGGVRFYRPDRGIDITAVSGEIELNGALSRSVFTFSEAGIYSNKRGLLGELTLGSYVPAPGGPGQIRVKLPGSATDGIFASQYAPGAGFGCFDITFAA